MRESKIRRTTKETDIQMELNLDGSGRADVETGIGFLDHMLDAFSRHGGFDLSIKATGDLIVDDHHLIEDTAIVLGQAILEAIGDKKGIARFGDARIPMDEALADVILDLGGRSYLVFNAEFASPTVGNLNTQMIRHFFASLAENGKMNIHVSVEGYNDHHKIEALFKAFAYALKKAVNIEGDQLKSTKGVL